MLFFMIRGADVKGENQHYEDLLDRYNALLTRNNNMTRDAIIEDRLAREAKKRDVPGIFQVGDMVTWKSSATGNTRMDKVTRITASGAVELKRRPGRLYNAKLFTRKKTPQPPSESE